jgi:hypothetical protein
VPLVLSLVALALGTLGLIFGVYGAVVARKSQGINNRALQGVQLTSFPDKDAARVTGSMWQGTGYFARLQPMMFSRSDHRVRLATTATCIPRDGAYCCSCPVTRKDQACCHP